MKYVIFKYIFPVLVHDATQHSDVRCGMGDATSAGFVHIDFEKEEVHPYGESVSLRLKPNPEDGAILAKFLFDP